MSKKILYTIGDNFTYGTDLGNHEIECYPYLLSKKLGCELVNEALPSASNDWMFRKSIEWIASNDVIKVHTFIVGWSHPDRREEHFEFYHGGPLKESQRHRGRNSHISDYISIYLYDARLSSIKSFIYIYTLQEILKKNNINYLFVFPQFNELTQDEWYEKNIKSHVHNIYLKIDQRYILDLEMKEIPTGKHPNKNQHMIMSNKIFNCLKG